MSEEFESWKILVENAKRLERAGIENFVEESRWLMQYAWDCTYPDIVSGKLNPVPLEKIEALNKLMRRRVAREPLQYIVGTQFFCGMELIVKPGVLVPRRETVELVQLVINTYVSIYGNDTKKMSDDNLKLLDIYTGTGCILLALMKFFPMISGLGIDLDEHAVHCARQNAQALNLDPYLEFDNISSAMEKLIGVKFDIVTANPPYIPTAQINDLMPEVRDYENHMALDGGEDGLDHYKFLAKRVHKVMKPRGKIIMECGKGQGQSVAEIFEEWDEVRLYSDYNGIDIVMASYGHEGGDSANVTANLVPPLTEDKGEAEVDKHDADAYSKDYADN